MVILDMFIIFIKPFPVDVDIWTGHAMVILVTQEDCRSKIENSGGGGGTNPCFLFI